MRYQKQSRHLDQCAGSHKMSPRSRQSSSINSNTTRTTGPKRTSRISPDMSNIPIGPVSDNLSSHYVMDSPSECAYSGSPSWNSDASYRSSGNDLSGIDSMQLDDLTIGETFMMPMLPVNDCFDAVPSAYPALSHGAMSQTLTGPYQESLFENDMMISTNMCYNDYAHFPQATIRHGLPSPPADCYNEYSDDLSMDTSRDLAFSTLPGPTMDMNMSYEKMPPARFVSYSDSADPWVNFDGSASRQAQPRPIRSASERSITDQLTVGPQDVHFSRDERADKVKARSDPRYDQKPDEAGYYHCPMVAEEPCNHKPTKQKCIYAKYLDSHLKPYICKHGSPGNDCENLRFSSNACLFRHEREAHGMHNHGMNPYLCLYPGCERARIDNGFPRRWNQRDHMKRVHDWVETEADDAATDKYGSIDTSRRRKSATSHSVQMKRSSSSQARAQTANNNRGSRTTHGSRYEHPSGKHNQDCSVPEYLMPVVDARYPAYHQTSRTMQPYTDSYGQLTY